MTTRRPAFANDFPRRPELDELVEAFARGDYARVRARAPELERSSEDPLVKSAARTLNERTRPDPSAVILVVMTAILLVVLSVWAIAHGKHP